MINDPHRGHVWEQCIMLLPQQIQLIGLSATLDNPEKFAYWLENRGNNVPLPLESQKNNDDNNDNNNKIVYLTSKKERAVPLTHYSFLTMNQTVFKMIKDKTLQQEIKSITDKPFIIQDSKGKFNEEHYSRMNKVLKLFDEKDIRLKRAHVINNCLKYLTESEMTPAICYVFSIKKLEICAKEVTTNLLEFDSKIPYTIGRECEQILRKLPNFEEYLHLPDYLHLVSLLEKGVAIHHSKMLPILREIVELLFAKGYIKVLFATESVAIGLNLPVKTTIFTDINKFDGEHLRILLAHEYTQAAGRAGRLGLDTVGHVIHLNNLFRNVNIVNYKLMLNGKPQALVSKFKISYSLLLNLIDTGNMFFIEFSNKSMIKDELDSSLNEIYNQIMNTTKELEKMQEGHHYFRTPINILEEYVELITNRNSFVNKKRKEAVK
jgi:antiviral helicase SKI2